MLKPIYSQNSGPQKVFKILDFFVFFSNQGTVIPNQGTVTSIQVTVIIQTRERLFQIKEQLFRTRQW